MYDNECFNDTVDLVQDTPKVCGFVAILASFQLGI